MRMYHWCSSRQNAEDIVKNGWNPPHCDIRSARIINPLLCPQQGKDMVSLTPALRNRVWFDFKKALSLAPITPVLIEVDVKPSYIQPVAAIVRQFLTNRVIGLGLEMVIDRETINHYPRRIVDNPATDNLVEIGYLLCWGIVHELARAVSPKILKLSFQSVFKKGFGL